MPFRASFSLFMFIKILKLAIAFIRAPYVYDYKSFFPKCFHNIYKEGLKVLPFLDDFLLIIRHR